MSLALFVRALLGAAAAGIALLFPVDRAVVLDAYLLLVGALVLEGLVRAASVGQPEPGRPRLRRRRRPRAERPPDLVRLEGQVFLASASAVDLHVQLRPVLREIARELLLSDRGADLAGPEGRALLGEEAWELLRSDRPRPADRRARGLLPQRLAALVDAIEDAVMAPREGQAESLSLVSREGR